LESARGATTSGAITSQQRIEAMPIYEYQCQSCGHVLDALQKISDEPLKHCPDCGEPALRKLLSAPRFRLKGGGWYETDFKDKNRRNIASADSSKPESKSDKAGDAGTKDAKTDKADKADKTGKAEKKTKSDAKPAGD
jgi:putative FmdB family regulatory protein